MSSTFPASPDVFPGPPPYVDNVEYILAAYANSWVNAIASIEATIGAGTGTSVTNPLYSQSYSLTFTTLTQRIDHAEQRLVAQPIIDTNSSHIKPVAATGAASSSGSVGMTVDSTHVHQGVASFMGRSGVVVFLPNDLGSLFHTPGDLLVGSGSGTAVVIPGPTTVGYVLTDVGTTPDGTGLQWQPGGWLPGDVKTTTALSPPAGWLAADGSTYSRTGVTANLFNATTLQVSATLTANNATIAGLTAGVMAQLFVGCPVECAGALPSPGVTITALQTTSVTVSTNVAAGFGGAHTVTFLPYGQGDGVSSFNVIDLRGATVVGVGQGPGRTNRIQGQTFGTETVSMSVAQLPTHTHLSTDNGHQHCAGGVLSGTETDINGGEKLHWHYTVAVNSFGPTGWPYQVLVTAPSSTVNFLWGGPGGGRIPITPAPSDPGVPPQEWGTDPTNPPTTSPQVEPHQHMVFDNVVPSGVQIGNAIDATHTPASNQPLSNMPPSAVVRYLVKI